MDMDDELTLAEWARRRTETAGERGVAVAAENLYAGDVVALTADGDGRYRVRRWRGDGDLGLMRLACAVSTRAGEALWIDFAGGTTGPVREKGPEVTVDARPATARVLIDTPQAEIMVYDEEQRGLRRLDLATGRDGQRPLLRATEALGAGDTAAIDWEKYLVTRKRRAERQSWIPTGFGRTTVPTTPGLARQIRAATEDLMIVECSDAPRVCHRVSSSTGLGEMYHVVGDRCTCPDHLHRGVVCKHLRRVELGHSHFAEGQEALHGPEHTPVDWRAVEEHWNAVVPDAQWRIKFSLWDGKPILTRRELGERELAERLDDTRLRLYLRDPQGAWIFQTEREFATAEEAGDWFYQIYRKDETEQRAQTGPLPTRTTPWRVPLMSWAEADVSPAEVVRWLMAFRGEGVPVFARVEAGVVELLEEKELIDS